MVGWASPDSPQCGILRLLHNYQKNSCELNIGFIHVLGSPGRPLLFCACTATMAENLTTGNPPIKNGGITHPPKERCRLDYDAAQSKEYLQILVGIGVSEIDKHC